MTFWGFLYRCHTVLQKSTLSTIHLSYYSIFYSSRDLFHIKQNHNCSNMTVTFDVFGSNCSKNFAITPTKMEEKRCSIRKNHKTQWLIFTPPKKKGMDS